MTPELSSLYERIRQLPADQIEMLVARSEAFLDGLRAANPEPPKRGRPPRARKQKPEAEAEVLRPLTGARKFEPPAHRETSS